MSTSGLIEPSRADLELAHYFLNTKTPLDEMLQKKEFELILKNLARRLMQRRQQFDLKKLQANDIDDQ